MIVFSPQLHSELQTFSVQSPPLHPLSQPRATRHIAKTIIQGDVAIFSYVVKQPHFKKKFRTYRASPGLTCQIINCVKTVCLNSKHASDLHTLLLGAFPYGQRGLF